MFFFLWRTRLKKKLTIAGIIAAASVALVLGLFLLPRLSEHRVPSEPAQKADTVTNLGITYLRVTPKLSAYYDLGVDSGVLVTEVVSGSPIDQASVQAGDVIIRCNGVKLDEGVSLLGMMRECQPDDKLVFEVCSGKNCRIAECCGRCGTTDCDCRSSISKDK
jgi:predicted metalloprotease with PDZ domain